MLERWMLTLTDVNINIKCVYNKFLYIIRKSEFTNKLSKKRKLLLFLLSESSVETGKIINKDYSS